MTQYIFDQFKTPLADNAAIFVIIPNTWLDTASEPPPTSSLQRSNATSFMYVPLLTSGMEPLLEAMENRLFVGKCATLVGRQNEGRKGLRAECTRVVTT